MRLRLQPKQIESIFDTNDVVAIDTLDSGNDAIQVVLYSNNTWKYVRNREIAKDSTIFEKYWDTTTLFPYKEVDMSSMPKSVVIDLVDSVTSYHCPYQGSVHPRGKYGPRRRRQHQGVDLPLKAGDPVYATFCGRVRISEYNKGGYGNLVIIRHDNGLETYYGHLSERMVEPNQWVEAGQIIGLGGSTGRSTGPHLHFETRYYGQSFDPERLIDFKNGLLCRETFLLKKSFFSIYSNAGQDFDDEIANEEQDKKEAAEKAAMKYHRIKSGDTLGAIARKYGTTVTNICRLNGIKSTTTLRIGRSLRVRNSGKTVWGRLCDRKPPENGMFPGDNQIRVTSSARANLFLILDGVDGVDHGSPETLALQLPHTDDGRTAGRTDGILHHGGMLPRGELQLSRTDDHLAGHAVGIGTHDAVLDGSVGQRLDEHRHEGRAATAARPRNAELGGIHRHHEPHMRQQRLHRLPLGFGQRMAAFADDDTLADCHGRIGNRAEVMRPGREDLLVAVERHPGGYRNDDLARQHPFDGGQHSFDLVRFHRHDHHVGEPRDSCGIVESEEPVGFRITVQLRPVAGACADLPGLQSPRCGKPCGQGLRHISESDKSYLHIIIVWNNPSPRISATRHAPSSSRTRRRWGSRATCPSTGC